MTSGQGLLIVFEGAEGAGKSTQLRKLAECLGAAGRNVVAVREPGGTVVGDEIRRILLDPQSDIVPRAEALLFMASRAQLVERARSLAHTAHLQPVPQQHDVNQGDKLPEESFAKTEELCRDAIHQSN